MKTILQSFVYSTLCLFFIFNILSLQGCSTKERFKQTVTLEQFRAAVAQQEEKQNKKNEVTTAPMPEDIHPTGTEYLLGPGDLLDIKVFEAEELNTNARVSSRGNINLPLLNDVNIMNLTAAEAEKKVEVLYKEKYLQNPHVSIYLKERISKQITLVGAINRPGTYPYLTHCKLLDVLATGNGITDNAGSLAFITRTDYKNKKTSNYMVDLDDLIRNGNMDLNREIVGGDVIYIPKSGNYFVDGAVRVRGTFPIKGKMTIAEALTQAGGLSGWADENNIKLVRYIGQGKPRQVVTLSYQNIQQGIGDTLTLKDQDIIYAESSGSGRFFGGSGFTFGFMGTGITFSDPASK